MGTAEKRALLASWASDSRAVPGVPSARQLEDGTVVEIDDILRALKALDAHDHVAVPNDRRHTSPYIWRERRRLSALPKWPRIIRRHRRDDDDDDPPPSPVHARVPPRAGGGGAFVHPEPALA